MINWQQQTWQRATLPSDKAVQRSNAETHVFSDSVLCMGRISGNPVKREDRWFQSAFQYRELDRIDGEPMEFEWKNFPGFTTLQILAETKTWCKEQTGNNAFCSPSELRNPQCSRHGGIHDFLKEGSKKNTNPHYDEDSSCNRANSGTKSHGKARNRCEGNGKCSGRSRTW